MEIKANFNIIDLMILNFVLAMTLTTADYFTTSPALENK